MPENPTGTEPTGTEPTGAEPTGTVPALPDWIVPRPRLTDQLARGVRGPLTVVVGPVGAGKTALALEWAHTRRPPWPLAWVACDGPAEHPGVFWQRVFGALGAAGVVLPEPAAGEDVPLLVATLAARLNAHGEPSVLVLDDFQPALDSPIARGVTHLLRHAPDALRLVVLARRDPPLHLYRGRLTSEVTEVRTADLAFDDREAAALLAQHGIDVTRQTVSTLRRRADGWAAGLRLAAMSMEKCGDPERFVAQLAGDDEAISSYLVEEVLDQQSPGMRRLLLTTSVLDRVNAELAAELAGDADGSLFAGLVRENSFLRPVGQGWYRCHQMFADVLRTCLRHETPGLVAPLHRRAAVWLDGHGLLTDAVRHLLAADDWDAAARLVVRRLAVGQVLGLARRGLPVDAARQPAEERAADAPESVLLAAAVARTRGDDPACARNLERSARLLDELPPGEEDRAARCRLTHAVIRMDRLRCRDPRLARAAAADAESAGARVPHALLAERPEVTALILSVRGAGELRAGCLKAAQVSLTGGLKAAGAAGNGALRRDCLVELALLEALRGRFRAADELTAQATQPPMPPWTAGEPPRATLHLVRAWGALARGDPVRARHELTYSQGVLGKGSDEFLAEIGGVVARVAGTLERGGRGPDAVAEAVAVSRLPQSVQRIVAPTCARLLGPAHARRAATAGPPPEPSAPMDVPTERLSARERDVLDRLAQMMTTEEIADELYLSVNTVKTHLKSVYRKLAVSRRSAAVRRARELQIL
ncbi:MULTISPECIES: LuxR C-terminal-related transcriptional regulator [unclassified Streptomyces]|uniref:LuxR C-terminal-related transcriptional regulator n=1 Tax=unclassified Streptomyces TaxID=2593676 RepID=UPI00278BAEDE|nr:MULTISPECIES: LuxR C-terminal-related transcriptional regulator [unclassified Streptomyces]